MMRAVVQHGYGPLSVLESSKVGLPLPGRGDVLVQVGAASVHPGDYFVMTVTPVIDCTYPLDEAADALGCVAAGHTRGKVVITV